MADQFKIYLVNKAPSDRLFWCFLEKPEGLADETVYANSSTSLYVRSNDSGSNSFTIPVQFSGGASNSNEAVGLGTKIDAGSMNDVNLGDKIDITYFVPPPKQGPMLETKSGGGTADKIDLVTNAFDKQASEDQSWYPNQTFGIRTSSGLMGSTWSPTVNTTRKITPRLGFYVATGEFGENELMEYTELSNDSAELTPDSFSGINEATVTLNEDGTFTVTAGKPQ